MRAFASKYVDALKSARQRKRAIVICADLQVAMTDLDQTANAIKGGSGSTDAEREALKDLFSDNHYADLYRQLHPEGRETTSTASHEQWTGLPNGKEEVGKRIDYILGSSEIEALAYHIDQTPLTDGITDHAAVIATVRYYPVRPPCIEEYLRQNPSPKVRFKNTNETE
jgi:exonuclease III